MEMWVQPLLVRVHTEETERHLTDIYDTEVKRRQLSALFNFPLLTGQPDTF